MDVQICSRAGDLPRYWYCSLVSGLFCLRAEAQDTSPALPPRDSADSCGGRAGGRSRPREAELEDEVRQLKAMVRELVEQGRSAFGGPRPAQPPDPFAGRRMRPGLARRTPLVDDRRGTAWRAACRRRSIRAGGSQRCRRRLGGGPRAARRAPDVAIQHARHLAQFSRRPGSSGRAFSSRRDDEEFQLQFHDLTQVDGRFYTKGQQMPITSTFLIPRAVVHLQRPA